jgi:hypothetical protein
MISALPESREQRRVISILVCVLVASLLGVLAGAAFAATPKPVWEINAAAAPTVLPAGDHSGHDRIFLRAIDVGSSPAEGAVNAIVLTDQLDPGVEPTAVVGHVVHAGLAETEIPCVATPIPRCTIERPVAPYATIEMTISVSVAAGAKSGPSQASVSGGGGAHTTLTETTAVGSTPTAFGIEHFQLAATNEDGSPATQSGSHPYALTTGISLNQTIGLVPTGGVTNRGGLLAAVPASLPKDLQFDLPPGIIGDPAALPQCTGEQFTTFTVPNVFTDPNECPGEDAIGVADVAVSLEAGEERSFDVPLFNLTPQAGEPARFGFEVSGVSAYLDTSIRTGSGYGVRVNVSNLTEIAGFDSAVVTIWGTPGDPSHDPSRGWDCLVGGFPSNTAPACVDSDQTSPTPFLSLPTSCTGALTSTAAADSWEEPGTFHTATASTLNDGADNPIGLDGCGKLHFEPQITVAPDGTAGNTPSGLNVDVHVPQEEDLAAGGLSEAEVRDTTIAFPEGIAVSPGGADGLEACSLAQIGLEEPGEPSCPEASKIGTVEIDTPLLPNPLNGSLYLAAQNANPFGSLLASYIVVKDPVSGVLVKLAGKVTPNALTGQLTSTFENTPQLPFSDLKVNLFGGARAPFTTPPLCGTYTTHAVIAPWSGTPAAEPQSSFPITSGPNGTPCESPQPFAPGFQAGSLNLQAGAFTPFTLTMDRPDADQTLAAVNLKMPPGLLGMLSSVKLCPEPQAAQGTCGEESLIGHTTISAGLGNNPITVVGGKVYVTTGYKGAPYGLSIVNPAVAGPFNLGTVVVRATINVDPHTAVLSVQSDPLPTILQGIPLQLQHVNVTIDRPGFTFNPTNCSQMPITATLSSSEGASAPVSSPFQVTNCANLKFAPKFAVSTAGKTSKASGASLKVKLSYPTGTSYANIKSVKVDLPKQLPSRLTTLQKACVAKVFEANPANCPKASIVGQAKAVTPILPVPLVGPAYFVSHGGEAFPSLIVVLQGYGVTLDLVGTTFISHAGITSSTFKTVPDAPVGSFELTLPEGKYSALAANGNLCKSKLVMPTAFVAQNGLELKQSTKIAVNGCPKAHKAAKKKHKAKKASADRRGK